MNKSIVSTLCALAFFGASVASAQTLNYGYGYGYPAYTNTYTSCTNIASDLAYGARGTDVKTLQSFLITQNIPGAGDWMVTGYFGRATYAAVQAFQQMQNLPTTGTADSNTRAAIARLTCGGYGYAQSYYQQTNLPYYSNTYSNNYCYGAYPYNYGYGYNQYCNNSYGNYAAVHITSLSTYSGTPGQSVTVYGTGFDANNNNVSFGGSTLTSITSNNGTSLTFTVPSYAAGNTVQVYVVSSRGRSNAVTFSVLGGTSCGYPYNYGYDQYCCNGYNNSCCGYGNQYNCYTGAPTISGVSGPTSLSTGGQGTWSLTINNPNPAYASVSVNWGDTGAYGYGVASASQTVNAQGSQMLSFTHTYYTAGTYTITFTVTNGTGQSNMSTATVNVGGGSYNNVTLGSLSPTSGHVGTQVTLYGSGFAVNDNIVHFGAGGLRYVPSLNSGTMITFTIPYYVSACDLIGNPCGASVQQVLPGTYAIYVSNSNGTSQQLTFTVN